MMSCASHGHDRCLFHTSFHAQVSSASAHNFVRPTTFQTHPIIFKLARAYIFSHRWHVPLITSYHVLQVSIFCSQCTAMSAYSFQTMLQPVQQLAEMRVHLRQCRQVLQQMQALRLPAMTTIGTLLQDATQVLDDFQIELDRLEHQFLCILQLQVSHHLTLHGTLPDIDLDD